MTAAELTDLLALEWLDPPIGDRIDIGFAMLAYLVVARTRGKNEPRQKIEAFMPKYGPRDADELAGKIKARFMRMKRKN